MASPSPVAAKHPAQRPEPSMYTFRLTKKYDEFFIGSSPFAARLALPNSDVILWPYVNGKPVGFKANFEPSNATYQARTIRYISGSPTIFVDEQEANGSDTYKRNEMGLNPTLDNPANKDDLTFQRGEIKVPSYNTALLSYLWCRNDCANQYARANQPSQIKGQPGKRMKPLLIQYELIDYMGQDAAKVALGDFRKRAYEIARDARNEEMIPHAKFLNIQFNHSGTDQEKDIAAIKEEYIDYALANPKNFLDTFNDPRMKMIHQIRTLVEGEDNQITFLKTPGQAHWISTGTFIAQIPEGKDPVEFLAEFSMTKEGEEFADNLRALK